MTCAGSTRSASQPGSLAKRSAQGQAVDPLLVDPIAIAGGKEEYSAEPACTLPDELSCMQCSTF